MISTSSISVSLLSVYLCIIYLLPQTNFFGHVYEPPCLSIRPSGPYFS